MIFLGFFIAVGWGLTFVLTKNSIGHVSPFLFVSLRFLAAAMTLLPVLVWRQRSSSREEISFNCLASGALVGMFLFGGYWLQSLGLRSTSASQAGFIMGLAPVMVPFLAILFLRANIPFQAWVGILFAILGLPLLSLDSELVLDEGSLFCMGSALSFACHVILLQHLLKKYSAFSLTVIQVSATALMSLGVVVCLEPLSLQGAHDIWMNRPLVLSILFCGVGATALSTLAQCYLQQNLSIVKCALIFSNEPVFAAVFGYVFLDERLSDFQILGAVMMLIGVIEAEVGLLSRLLVRKAEKVRKVEKATA